MFQFSAMPELIILRNDYDFLIFIHQYGCYLSLVYAICDG